MNDKVTGKRVVVQTDGDAGPYIIVSESQVETVRSAFTSSDMPFNESKRSIVGKNGPDSVFDLGQGADVAMVQELLDDLN